MHKKTKLALRALRTLHQRSAVVSGLDLASEIGTSANYLPQVMAPLVSSFWVRSERGPNGGYTLGDVASTITMRSLIQAVEGGQSPQQCVLRGGPCPGEETCALHDSWQQVQDSLLRELDQIPVFETKE